MEKTKFKHFMSMLKQIKKDILEDPFTEEQKTEVIKEIVDVL